jgi:hypothetical protein
MTTKVRTIYKFASKLTWVGIIQANSEKEAIEGEGSILDS